MFAVKKIFFISLIIGVVALNAYTSTDAEKKSIEVTKDIKYLSQKIANDYLHLYHDSKKSDVKAQLQNSIKKLEDDFRFIAKNTSNPDTKNILDFLSYNKDQIKEILADEVSKENASSILDLSDTLLEGVKSILSQEKQTHLEQKFHLMRISRLYMAINLKFDSKNNRSELKQEIALFKHLKSNYSWLAFKAILDGKQRCFVPNITSILVKDLENNLGKL